MNKFQIISLISIALLTSQCNQYRTKEDSHKVEKVAKEKEITLSSEELAKYTEKGFEYVMQTKGALGKNLMGTITKEGTVAALSFCNKKAYPLTDSVANILNVQIKRVSDKNRNPKNKANTVELAYIEKIKTHINLGEKPKPYTIEKEDKILSYYPIMTNGMCMQCHGKSNEEILPNTLAKLNELYPEDKAQGYGINELRGIWVVEMNKRLK